MAETFLKSGTRVSISLNPRTLGKACSEGRTAKEPRSKYNLLEVELVTLLQRTQALLLR